MSSLTSQLIIYLAIIVQKNLSKLNGMLGGSKRNMRIWTKGRKKVGSKYLYDFTVIIYIYLLAYYGKTRRGETLGIYYKLAFFFTRLFLTIYVCIYTQPLNLKLVAFVMSAKHIDEIPEILLTM